MTYNHHPRCYRLGRFRTLAVGPIADCSNLHQSRVLVLDIGRYLYYQMSSKTLQNEQFTYHYYHRLAYTLCPSLHSRPLSAGEVRIHGG